MWQRRPDQRRRMAAFYSQFMSPGDLVIDVGANYGAFTEVFLRLGARVVAVEPQQRCLAYLERRYSDSPDVSIVPLGLGEREGPQELHVSSASTLSTMSPRWIAATSESGRFAGYSWEETHTVELTTLERLIDQHGVPAFCKVDVEGFELEVLRGLDTRPGALSIEFASEFLDQTNLCVERLTEIGASEFSYSVGSSMTLASDWISDREVISSLSRLGGELPSGDLYARFPDHG